MAQVTGATPLTAKGAKGITLPRSFFSADRAEDFFRHPFLTSENLRAHLREIKGLTRGSRCGLGNIWLLQAFHFFVLGGRSFLVAGTPLALAVGAGALSAGAGPNERGRGEKTGHDEKRDDFFHEASPFLNDPLV
jgi:hypothetical protein